MTEGLYSRSKRLSIAIGPVVCVPPIAAAGLAVVMCRAASPVLSRLMLETMRRAERDPSLRERMSAMMGSYRDMISDLIRSEQQRGLLAAGLPGDGLATLLGAVGDGLLLHALLDPNLGLGAALDALRDLLTRPAKTRPETGDDSAAQPWDVGQVRPEFLDAGEDPVRGQPLQSSDGGRAVVEGVLGRGGDLVAAGQRGRRGGVRLVRHTALPVQMSAWWWHAGGRAFVPAIGADSAVPADRQRSAVTVRCAPLAPFSVIRRVPLRVGR